MFNQLKVTIKNRLFPELPDPWAQAEAEYEDLLRQHPSLAREQNLNVISVGLSTGLSVDFLEKMYPELTSEIREMAKKAAIS